MPETPSRICFVSDHTYLPDRVGGRESSIDDLSRLLGNRGHHVTIVANRGSLRELPKRVANRLLWKTPYLVRRVKDERSTARDLLLRGEVDVIVYNVARAADFVLDEPRLRERQIFFIRDAEDNSLAGLAGVSRIRFIANSHFTASLVHDRVGRWPFVFQPLVDPTKYTVPHTGRLVTFINPVEKKGLTRALAVAAALRDVDFLFVEGWELTSRQKKELASHAKRLGNIRLMSATTHAGRIYEKTRVLMVPSVWAEAFGRVSIEAQINGIPVIASHIGGLTESVGDGGILIDPQAPTDEWVEAVRSTIEDDELWNRLSRRALSHSRGYTCANTTRIDRFIAWIAEGSLGA